MGNSATIGFGAVGGNDAPLHNIARTVCAGSLTWKTVNLINNPVCLHKIFSHRSGNIIHALVYIRWFRFCVGHQMWPRLKMMKYCKVDDFVIPILTETINQVSETPLEWVLVSHMGIQTPLATSYNLRMPVLSNAHGEPASVAPSHANLDPGVNGTGTVLLRTCLPANTQTKIYFHHCIIW